MKQSQPKKADLGKFERNAVILRNTAILCNTITLLHKANFSTRNQTWRLLWNATKQSKPRLWKRGHFGVKLIFFFQM